MNCYECSHFLHRYLDEEYVEKEKVEFEYHIAHCESCRLELEYHKALRQKMRESLPREMPPLYLEGRISALLREEEQQRSHFWFSFSIAALASSLAVILLFFPDLRTSLLSSMTSSPQHARYTHTQEQPTPYHLSLPKRSPSQLSAFSSPSIRAFPANKTPQLVLSQRQNAFQPWPHDKGASEALPDNDAQLLKRQRLFSCERNGLISPLYVNTNPSSLNSLCSREKDQEH